MLLFLMVIFLFFLSLLFRLIVSSFQLTIEFIMDYYFSIVDDLKPENLLLQAKKTMLYSNSPISDLPKKVEKKE